MSGVGAMQRETRAALGILAVAPSSIITWIGRPSQISRHGFEALEHRRTPRWR